MVMHAAAGDFKRYVFYPANPNVVLVDTGLVARAPVRLLVAGMGDALATWFEAESCQRKYAPNMGGRVGSMTAYALARLCYETLLNYGVLAKSGPARPRSSRRRWSAWWRPTRCCPGWASRAAGWQRPTPFTTV
jgi:glycerol dehydrogenase-like iron-containing ADH family enzyme